MRDGGFYQVDEKRCWTLHRTLVLRVELNTDKPRMVFQLHYFHQTRLVVDTTALHSGRFQLSAEVVVEFETVTVTF